MSELEVGPSSFSTLHFVPNFIKELLDDNDPALMAKEHQPSKNHRHTALNSRSSINIHSKKSNTNPRYINRKAVSDQETMAFVAMRDILNISDSKLARLYNYNKREYDTFQAVINNKNINHKQWLNSNEVMVLYHFFARISGQCSWMEICDDLGFLRYFNSEHFKALFQDINNIQIRAKDEQLFELRFFMKLLIFFWDNLSEGSHKFACFWVKTLGKIIKFISELAVGINIEIYCASTQQWINATILRINQSKNQIYAQCRNGSNQHQWISIYSPRLAPIGFKYSYTPNMMKKNNVPCITAVIDDTLNHLASNHVTVRFKRNVSNVSRCDSDVNINTNVYHATVRDNINHNTATRITSAQQRLYSIIPKDGWHYQLSNGAQNGPVAIGKLFISCVEREIDENSYVYHAQFGATTLKKLPHIVNFFRAHIQKCKRQMEMHQKSRSCSTSSGTTGHGRNAELSIFTTCSTSAPSSLAHSNSNRNRNVFIAESNINRFK